MRTGPQPQKPTQSPHFLDSEKLEGELSIAFNDAGVVCSPEEGTRPVAAQLLCFGHDEMLLKTRKWMLEKHACVELVRELSNVSALVQRNFYDVAILCHTLSPEERRKATDLLTTFSPKIRIICLAAVSEGQGRHISKDACILTGSAAHALVSTVTSILEPVQTASRPNLFATAPVQRQRDTES